MTTTTPLRSVRQGPALVLTIHRPTASLSAALELAELIAEHTRASVAAVKRSLTEARCAARGDALSRERAVFRRAWGSASHREAMAAFLSRRSTPAQEG